jgi:hypothetical protein
VEMVKLRRGLILSDVEKELYMKLEHLNSGNSK